jgi:prostaglandin-endoperoxide synthase 2
VTDRLRSGRGGTLKSQLIDGQEYPPFFYQEVHPYPKADVVDPQFEGVYRPSLLEQIQSPERKAKLFATGVDRGNAQIGFVAINTICLREHNRLCEAMAERYPDWDDERLFQTARNTLIGIIARIVVEEYINHIKPYHFDFIFDPMAFRRQRWYRQNWMTVEFSMVYRWHMALPSVLRHRGRPIPMQDTLFNNQMLIDEGPGSILGEASRQPGGRIGLHNTPDFLLHLEETTVQWGRETRLRSYNDYRAYCGFPRVTDFDQITGDLEVQRELKSLYGDVDSIEFYVGILAEDLRPGSALAPLMGRLIGVDAFSQALTSPLLAERVFNPATFSQVGWEAIRQTGTLQDLVHRNVPERESGFPIKFNL